MFRFEFFTYIYLLALVPVLFLLIYLTWKWNKQKLSSWGDLALLKSLMPLHSDSIFWKRNIFILVGLTLIISSGTNPQFGSKREKVETQSSDVIIALDISTSMLAQDVAPSRMERAKRFTMNLIDALKGNRIGLIYFANSSFLQSPLTNDYAATKLLVKSASPLLAGVQGTNIKSAIELAERTYQKEKNNQRGLIIVTDGEHHDEEIINAASDAAENGSYIYCVGVGTENGGPIPEVVRNKIVYKKDEAGNPVTTKLNVDLINDIAKNGRGKAFLATQGSQAIEKIVADIEKIEKKKVQQLSFTTFNSYFQYLLFPGFVCIAIGLLYPFRIKPNK